MIQTPQSRRVLLLAGAATAGATLATGVSGLLSPARAGPRTTPTMRAAPTTTGPARRSWSASAAAASG